MQRILLPGSYQGKKNPHLWAQRQSDIFPAWWTATASGMDEGGRACEYQPRKQHARCSRQVSSSLYPSPGLSISCHSSAHQPARTSWGCQRDCWWDSAPACQSSLFLFSTRKIFWLRETKKPGQWWFAVKNFLLGLDIWLLTSTDPTSPWVMSGYRIDRENSKNLFC